MTLYRLHPNELELIPRTTLTAERVLERADLQRLLRSQPSVLDADLFIVAEEFSDWSDSRRRIDLLGLDRLGTLVVIELKRSDDESFLDLQAIRYAAMVSNITFEQLVQAHQRFLAAQPGPDAADAEDRMRAFLGIGPDDQPDIQTARPRIILVSSSFVPELTTSVLWLNSCGLDVRCIRVTPYRSEEQLLLDVAQVVPLQEASDYLVRLGRKTTEDVVNARKRNELTRHVLVDRGVLQQGTEIVFDARTLKDWAWPDARMGRAHISAAPRSPKNVVWEYDSNTYSLSGLTGVMRDHFHLPVPRDLNGYVYWCLATDLDTNLWELAQKASGASEE